MAAASIISPLNFNCRALTDRSTYRHNNDIEIKVTYVRIITSAPLPSTITVAFFPPREAESSLTVNGKAASPVLALRRSRADAAAAAGESVYLSTDLMKFAGGCIGFEIRGRHDGGGATSPLVVGLVVRQSGGQCAMQCREAGGLDGGLVDLYFVGSSGGRAVLLNKAVEVRKKLDCFILPASEAQLAIADRMGLEKGIMEEENDEGRGIEEDEEEELSWFSEGVKVGMGLGLAMSLGVGVGVSLMMKSLQAAATVLKRLM